MADLRQKISAQVASHGKSFSRANITAFAATAVDFSTLYCLVEFGNLYYVFATACAAVLGALTNFTLNRYWAFSDGHGHVHIQGVRYAAVSGGSLILNTALVFLFTEFTRYRYLSSKVFAALAVGWGWNYPLHRYFVFPQPRRTS